jgi:hypothetical protein
MLRVGAKKCIAKLKMNQIPSMAHINFDVRLQYSRARSGVKGLCDILLVSLSSFLSHSQNRDLCVGDLLLLISLPSYGAERQSMAKVFAVSNMMRRNTDRNYGHLNKEYPTLSHCLL